MQEEQLTDTVKEAMSRIVKEKLRGVRKRESEGGEGLYRKSSCDHGSGAASDPDSK